MKITEVRVTLAGATNDRLRAFCSITLDDEFVIRDLRVIESGDGYFVAMPNRKVTERCRHCKSSNHVRAKFCNQCGGKIDMVASPEDLEARDRLHVDIAHPINAETRQRVQEVVLEEFEAEMKRQREGRNAGV